MIYLDIQQKVHERIYNRNLFLVDYEFIRVLTDNDDVYIRFNDLFPLYVPKRRYFRRNNNDQAFTILGQPKKVDKKDDKKE